MVFDNLQKLLMNEFLIIRERLLKLFGVGMCTITQAKQHGMNHRLLMHGLCLQLLNPSVCLFENIENLVGVVWCHK